MGLNAANENDGKLACNAQKELHVKENTRNRRKTHKLADIIQTVHSHVFVSACVGCSFMTSPWGPCSATCGVSVRSRRVQCRAFDEQTMSVKDLPDSSCKGYAETYQRNATLILKHAKYK